MSQINIQRLISFNLHTPVEQKVTDEVVFRRFQGKGVDFFLNPTSLTSPPSDESVLIRNFLRNGRVRG